MAELGAQVYSVEIIEELSTGAKQRLDTAGYRNVDLRIGNGYYGWQDHAPYDKILVAAAPEQPPGPLLEQLKPGGRMVLPIGSLDEEQQLVMIQKEYGGALDTKPVLPVRFAPLVMAH